MSKQPDDAASVHAYIAQEVAKHPVLVFMKGTPTAPQCGFSNIVCRVLDSHGPAARHAPTSKRSPVAHKQALNMRAATCCRTRR